MRFLTLLLVASLIAASCGGASDPGAVTPSTASTAAPTPTTSTTMPATTTTTSPTTTTTVAPTTTATLSPEAASVFFILGFEALRADLIEILDGDSNVQSVDKFVAEALVPGDPLTVTVVLDITSRWSHPDNQHDGAWELTRALAVLWNKEKGPFYQEPWSPAFRLVNSGRAYECSAEFLTSLADARSSRSDWERECAS